MKFTNPFSIREFRSLWSVEFGSLDFSSIAPAELEPNSKSVMYILTSVFVSPNSSNIFMSIILPFGRSYI